MSEERKKPGWIFWSMMALAIILVVYPLSLGPAMWLTYYSGCEPVQIAAAIYMCPAMSIAEYLPDPMVSMLGRYTGWCTLQLIELLGVHESTLQ